MTLSFTHSAFQMGDSTSFSNLWSSDFDGDGNADIALQISASIKLFYGRGDGTFRMERLDNQWLGGSRLAAADIDGNGLFDLFATNNYSRPDRNSGFRLMLQWQDGFMIGGIDDIVSVVLAHGRPTDSLLPADFDGDGRPDIACGQSIFRNLGGGMLSAPVRAMPAANREIVYITSGDVDSDGKRDLAYAGSGLMVLRGGGDGTFGPAEILTNDIIQTAKVEDVDGDGRNELLVYNRSALRYEITNGLGGDFVPASPTVRGHADPLVNLWSGLADFDRDGHLDLCDYPYMGTGDPDGSVVRVLLGNGFGGFAAPIEVRPSGIYAEPVIADFNNDGKPDIAVVHALVDRQRTIGIFLNDSH